MKRQALKELHLADIKELINQLSLRQQELVKLRMELYSGKNKNWRGLAFKRDEIAKIKTIITAKTKGVLNK